MYSPSGMQSSLEFWALIYSALRNHFIFPASWPRLLLLQTQVIQKFVSCRIATAQKRDAQPYSRAGS